MKTLLVFIFLILTFNVYSQKNLRIPQRTFNYGLAYGPRSDGFFYSLGYELNMDGSNSNIELGYKKLMLGLNMFTSDKWVLNSDDNLPFFSVNYVFRSEEYTWLMLVSGVGVSTENIKRTIFKIGVNLEISYPFFLTLNFYRTDISKIMVGFKIIIF